MAEIFFFLTPRLPVHGPTPALSWVCPRFQDTDTNKSEHKNGKRVPDLVFDGPNAVGISFGGHR